MISLCLYVKSTFALVLEATSSPRAGTPQNLHQTHRSCVQVSARSFSCIRNPTAPVPLTGQRMFHVSPPRPWQTELSYVPV